ncbi:hypothetical protein EVAR_50612_1 [Eumeta japonica]|uniref:Uncharacterized protein n=1 Tax=Eumeta variegata TaxID=151549 RepID=A0A4C1Y9J6_EUMVA|nr:hypothetical protein EVAR_50612_1 [Eumeta japonica]
MVTGSAEAQVELWESASSTKRAAAASRQSWNHFAHSARATHACILNRKKRERGLLLFCAALLPYHCARPRPKLKAVAAS